jgi:hypothetical protein
MFEVVSMRPPANLDCSQLVWGTFSPTKLRWRLRVKQTVQFSRLLLENSVFLSRHTSPYQFFPSQFHCDLNKLHPFFLEILLKSYYKNDFSITLDDFCVIFER